MPASESYKLHPFEPLTQSDFERMQRDYNKVITLRERLDVPEHDRDLEFLKKRFLEGITDETVYQFILHVAERSRDTVGIVAACVILYDALIAKRQEAELAELETE